MSEWLARKNGQPPQPPAPQPHYPYPQQPAPAYPYPPQQYPPQQGYYQPQFAPPPQAWPQQYQQMPHQQPQAYGPPLLPNGKLDVAAAKAMYGKDYEGIVANMWQGGEGTRTENTSCPKCRDGVLFSMQNSEGIVNVNTGIMAHTAPYCATCGYRPGKQMQGDAGNWATVG